VIFVPGTTAPFRLMFFASRSLIVKELCCGTHD
jgi:hypothetical protein